MHEVTNVLVGVDFSGHSSRALKEAETIANITGANLHVAHFIDKHVVDELVSLENDTESEILSRTKHTLKENIEEQIDVAKLGDRLKYDVLVGSPIGLMLEVIEHQNIDLVVIGERGSHDDGRNTGAFALKCIQKAPVKILLTSSDHVQAPYKKIVACIDFSKHSQEILKQAALLAERDGASLTLLHVYFGPWHKVHYRAPNPTADSDFIHSYKQNLEGRLAELSKSINEAHPNLTVKYELCENSNDTDGILGYLKENDVHLAVMGKRGKNPFVEMLLGSTVEKVLRNLPCSVLAIRAK